MINQSENYQPRDNEQNIVDFKQFVAAVVNNWYLFAISAIICLVVASLFAYYTPSYWTVKSKILVEDPKNSSSAMAQNSINADFSSLFGVKNNVVNEIQILKSRNLMEEVVKKLQLNIRTFRINGLKSTEIYQEAPFNIKLNYYADTLAQKKYLINFQQDGHYVLSNNEDNIKLIAKPGEKVKLKQYDLILNLNPGHNQHELRSQYSTTIESVDATNDVLSGSFNVVLSDIQATTIDLSLNYPHPKKGEAILEGLTQLYLLSNFQNKVQMADNTIAFIDNRIALVGNELNDIEQRFEQYKTQENIVDIGEQSKALVGSAGQYYDRLNQEETQLRVVTEVEKILSSGNNKTLVPSSMIAPGDLSFAQEINTYNLLLIERDKASLAYTPDNPVIQNFSAQIETARQTLLKNINAYKRNLQIAKSSLQNQNKHVSNQLQKVPEKERGYLGFQRKQSLEQSLYLFLLQKKEETAISKTSTISSSRIIDPAKSGFVPYAPKRTYYEIVGLILGLIIPGLYQFFKQLLNLRVNSKEDILSNTQVSVVGEIGHSHLKESLVTSSNSRSAISEQFRNIRTKLNYLLEPNKSQVILITSGMSGEGKSFISLNLGSTLALTGKKVIFMELDLRKPKLSESIGVDYKVNGYTNYLVSEFTDINKLIKPTDFNENCSIISSGPVPPNPSELLSHEKLGELIKKLKIDFDYLIIDCAPVGLVSDALLIEKYADLTLFIVREKYTYKSQLNLINDLKNNNEVKNLYLIYNDVIAKRAGYYTYGSGYGYGYYDDETNKNSLFSRLFKK